MWPLEFGLGTLNPRFGVAPRVGVRDSQSTLRVYRRGTGWGSRSRMVVGVGIPVQGTVGEAVGLPVSVHVGVGAVLGVVVGVGKGLVVTVDVTVIVHDGVPVGEPLTLGDGDALQGGGGCPPTPSKAPNLCLATGSLAASCSFNGICNRQ